MRTFIYPVSAAFRDMMKICQYFDTLEGFEVLLTGNWSMSGIISWHDPKINYWAVNQMLLKVVNDELNISKGI